MRSIFKYPTNYKSNQFKIKTITNLTKNGKKILITGGSGLVGTALAEKLTKKGFQTISLSIRKKAVNGSTVFQWNPEEMTIDNNALRGVSHIINLAGENISKKRWTKKQKI